MTPLRLRVSILFVCPLSHKKDILQRCYHPSDNCGFILYIGIKTGHHRSNVILNSDFVNRRKRVAGCPYSVPSKASYCESNVLCIGRPITCLTAKSSKRITFQDPGSIFKIYYYRAILSMRHLPFSRTKILDCGSNRW